MGALCFRKGSAAAALLAGLAGVATAYGQDGVGVQSGGGVQVQSGSASGEIGAQTRPAVTADQQSAEAESIARRATQLAERLTKMLDEARREKDIMRANCINRKLTEVNANARNVEQRARALKDAAAVGDDSRRSHEYTVLTVLSQKLDMLDQEASQCLGQSVFEPGASQVVTTVPANSPTVDPTIVTAPPPAPPSVTVPPPLSATK